MNHGTDDWAGMLEAAADVLDSGRVDWIQGDLVLLGQRTKESEPEVLACCAVGALAVGNFIHTNGVTQALTDLVEDNVSSALVDILEQQLNLDPKYALVDWNDEPERTKQEVIDLFKNTAKGLRNGEITP